jgi:hypothetical protein
MQLFQRRHSFGEVDVRRFRHKAIPATMDLQRASPREAIACSRQS